ncbi:MAG: hypothetical protein Q4B26_08970 [Eubacteriales bacterium]|nr:hypothetical protein [Eubacteriales bacterium]
MKIGFYTTDKAEQKEVYGSRTADLAGLVKKDAAVFPVDLEGESFYGTYEECLEFVTGKDRKEIKAVISISDDPGKENWFLQKLSELAECPIVGGGAARNGGMAGDGLAAGRGQAALFVITDSRVKATAETVNIHEHILETCHLELLDPRTIKTINGQDAAAFLKEKKEAHGFRENDFEHMTLSTPENINAHLSMVDGVVKSGRDLEETMILRYVKTEEAHNKIVEFYQNAGEDSIVFGCAGLGSLLESRFDCNTLGTFLYGETCTTEKVRDFGNLMLSKITFQVESK